MAHAPKICWTNKWMSEKVTPLASDGCSNRGRWWHSRFFLLLAPERNSSCVLDQEQPSLHCRMHPSRVLEDFLGVMQMQMTLTALRFRSLISTALFSKLKLTSLRTHLWFSFSITLLQLPFSYFLFFILFVLVIYIFLFFFCCHWVSYLSSKILMILLSLKRKIIFLFIYFAFCFSIEFHTFELRGILSPS